MVSEQLLKELQLIVKEDYGCDLDMAAVAEIGNTMVKYFDLLAELHHKEKTS